MKNIIFMAFIAIGLSSTSCKKEEKEELSRTIANVSVQNASGDKQTGITVYMFDKPANQTFGDDPMFAKKSVVTEANGTASFELAEVFDLNTIDSQTTLYFTVFEGTNNEVAGTVGLTIKKNETKSVSLQLN